MLQKLIQISNIYDNKFNQKIYFDFSLYFKKIKSFYI